MIALLGVCLLMTCVWATHLRDEDASIIDPFWGVGIVLVGLSGVWAGGVYQTTTISVGCTYIRKRCLKRLEIGQFVTYNMLPVILKIKF